MVKQIFRSEFCELTNASEVINQLMQSPHWINGEHPLQLSSSEKFFNERLGKLTSSIQQCEYKRHGTVAFNMKYNANM